ncbi:translation factor GTPase family protein [Lachnoclostridium sp. MSJ-17]|uniref:translation factor GTPase family protein n=1 Tax=Lachnoclostridium sp. MSJ-17 TaxID=2841516 RepID=UPI001C111072|nr:TetM/TetW/TetO/TetS family tetracycline resistance ribosomal protection protein [Lachnoclostridium sp. MSJ-17]MBU5461801.1 TetM/TetW/TetO/TetS family tetracycline resistance ribosomal protection protein [Lachnoclostridium sp. MSJ-17]
MKKIAVGILAHVDSGKTTLSEALLYSSGAIGRLGRVDHRDAFLDTNTLERERGITIFSKQAVFSCGDTEFTLLDTPGHVDFSAETERTLQVLDYAILVISGSDGVQSHTMTLWKLLRRYRVPTFIFVNKMDLDSSSREVVYYQLRTKLSEACVDFGGHDDLFENIALCGEDLLTKYESDTLCDADIVSAIRQRKVFPCFFGSALRLYGIGEFLDCLSKYTAMPNYGSEFAARVFKIAEDAQGNRLSFMKLTGGTLRVREVVKSDNNKNGEKVNQIRVYSGEKFTAVDEAAAGTVCAVTGLSFTRTGDGLGVEENAFLPVLEPVLSYSVILPDNIDAHTALAKFRILEAEDPQLNVVWNERLGEIQVRLMGEIQLEILKRVVSDRFEFEVNFDKGNIIYKETITETVEGVGHFEPLRHYAEVHLIMKPAKRDSGIAIRSECREDSLDKNWQRLILTHLSEKTHLGVLTGSPITDMEIILASGKAHAKHTEGGDFRQATYRAVRQGLRSAKSIILEPVFDFSLEVPIECVGRAMTDIQRMHGEFNPPDATEDSAVITGTAPVSGMRDYQREVVQYTRGKGRLQCSLKGYAPCHNPEEVIAAIGYDCDSDIENPSDSVFCSHGAGHNIKWNEVKKYMHLPSALEQPKPKPLTREKMIAECRTKEDFFILDKELLRIFEQTYGPVRKRTAAESKRHFSAPSDPKYQKQKPTYDGTEYVLVDGYNVIFSWEKLNELAQTNLDGARTALINILCNYQGFRQCELIVVFDAYRVKGNHREVEQVNGISVVYTKEAETADMYIEKTSHKLAKNNRVRVVTSDGLEQIIILGNGALRVSSRAFLDEVRAAEEEIRQIISEENQSFQ